MHRRQLLLGSLGAAMIRVLPASVGGVEEFDPKVFRAAQEAGQSIVVQVHATW